MLLHPNVHGEHLPVTRLEIHSPARRDVRRWRWRHGKGPNSRGKIAGMGSAAISAPYRLVEAIIPVRWLGSTLNASKLSLPQNVPIRASCQKQVARNLIWLRDSKRAGTTWCGPPWLGHILDVGMECVPAIWNTTVLRIRRLRTSGSVSTKGDSWWRGIFLQITGSR